MNIQGRIIAVLDAQEGVGANGAWKVQPYVLETINTEYPKKLYFEVFGADRIDRFPCEVGDYVDVSFDIESREYNGRWYTTARAWRIAVGTESTPAAQPVQEAKAEPKAAAEEKVSSELPF